jgi:histone acetyltransferase 1
VKQRLYRHNKDMLAQLEQAERIEKLEETVGSVEFEYARILDMHTRRSKHMVPVATNGKRKTEGESDESGRSKKMRIEDA